MGCDELQGFLLSPPLERGDQLLVLRAAPGSGCSTRRRLPHALDLTYQPGRIWLGFSRSAAQCR